MPGTFLSKYFSIFSFSFVFFPPFSFRFFFVRKMFRRKMLAEKKHRWKKIVKRQLAETKDVTEKWSARRPCDSAARSTKKKGNILYREHNCWPPRKIFYTANKIFFGREKCFIPRTRFSLVAKNVLYREQDFLWPRKHWWYGDMVMWWYDDMKISLIGSGHFFKRIFQLS